MEFTTGRAKTGGRIKGTPNQLTGDVKAMIVSAFHKAGGEAYLVEQARENPKAFLTLLSKTLPSENKTELTSRLTLGELVRRSYNKS